MTLERIIDMCKAYNNLGGAIQEQVGDVLDGRIDDVNLNALEEITRFLRKVREHADVNGDDELLEDVQGTLSDISDGIDDV